MLIIIGTVLFFGGFPGSGKTLQSFLYMDGTGKKKIVIDIENKAVKTYETNVKKGCITDKVEIFNPYEYNNDYTVDYVKTYKKLVNKLNVIKARNEYDIVVIDSYNRLRNGLCSEYFKQTTGKKGIVELDWTHVNRLVMDLIMPLANYVRITNKTLIVTCHIKDRYEKDVCVGKMPDVKDGFDHLGDINLILCKVKNTYTVDCIRCAIGDWESDVSGNTSIDILLSEKGLI